MPIPPFDHLGRLPPGVHHATWKEVAARFGGDEHRERLLGGFRAVCDGLAAAGCGVVYLDGSFVTRKDHPNDFDGCWDPAGVDASVLDPVLLDFRDRRAAQKAKFGGEMFLAGGTADARGNSFLQFFQVDRETGDAKGIIAIDLRNEP